MRHAADSIVTIEQRRTKSERKCKFSATQFDVVTVFVFVSIFCCLFFIYRCLFLFLFHCFVSTWLFARGDMQWRIKSRNRISKTEWRPIGNGDTFSPLLKPLFGVDEENADRTQNAPKKNVLTVPTHTNTRINTKIILSFVLIFFFVSLFASFSVSVYHSNTFAHDNSMTNFNWKVITFETL